MPANPKFDPIYLTPVKRGPYDFINDSQAMWHIMEREVADLDFCRCAHPDAPNAILRQGFLVCNRCRKVIVNGG